MQLTLSEQLKQDFLKDAYPKNMKVRTYDMSYDYLVDLIFQIRVLEDENTDLNQRLNLIHDKTLALDLALTQLKNKLEVL